MALGTPTLLTGGSDGTNGSSFTTASVSPTAGHPLFIAVTYRKTADEVTALSISGNGATWSLIGTATFSDANPDRYTKVFAADEASYSSGVVTITAGGSDTLDWGVWSVFQIENADTTPVQTASNSEQLNSPPNNLNADFSVTTDAANTVIGVFGVSGGAYTYTPAAGFTELSENTIVGVAGQAVHYVSASAESNVNADCNNGTTSIGMQALGLEIQEVAAATTTLGGLVGSNTGLVG